MLATMRRQDQVVVRHVGVRAAPGLAGVEDRREDVDEKSGMGAAAERAAGDAGPVVDAQR